MSVDANEQAEARFHWLGLRTTVIDRRYNATVIDRRYSTTVTDRRYNATATVTDCGGYCCAVP